jgi:hypothetical protein
MVDTTCEIVAPKWRLKYPGQRRVLAGIVQVSGTTAEPGHAEGKIAWAGFSIIHHVSTKSSGRNSTMLAAS